MLLLDYVFAVLCPQCKDSVFNLYEFGLASPVCLKCARASLALSPGSVKCHECHQFSVVEKSESLLVEKNNKRVRIINEFLYCSNCEAEGVTEHQLFMKKYRLAIALKYYKRPNQTGEIMSKRNPELPVRASHTKRATPSSRKCPRTI